ncbi:hypothetical protein B0H13DRAFT_1898396 [Mycena leptocephala]|nr:hypothetical protein B0H13DRAFT_1898396 [Mycena leptocephala]
MARARTWLIERGSVGTCAESGTYCRAVPAKVKVSFEQRGRRVGSQIVHPRVIGIEARDAGHHKGGHVHGKQETRFHRDIALRGMRGAIEPHHGALMKQRTFVELWIPELAQMLISLIVHLVELMATQNILEDVDILRARAFSEECTAGPPMRLTATGSLLIDKITFKKNSLCQIYFIPARNLPAGDQKSKSPNLETGVVVPTGNPPKEKRFKRKKIFEQATSRRRGEVTPSPLDHAADECQGYRANMSSPPAGRALRMRLLNTIPPYAVAYGASVDSSRTTPLDQCKHSEACKPPEAAVLRLDFMVTQVQQYFITHRL